MADNRLVRLSKFWFRNAPHSNNRAKAEKIAWYFLMHAFMQDAAHD